METRKKSRLFGTKITPYLLLLPTIALFCVFTYFPFVRNMSLAFSVTDKRGNPVSWVGLSNFTRLFGRPDFWETIQNTFMFAALVAVFTLLITTFLALLCTQQRKGGRIYETMYAIPMSIASVPASAMFLFIFKQSGILNQLLGTNIAWLIDSRTALPSVAFATVWLSIGHSFIFLLVGFRGVPEELIESATIDGAGSFRRAFSIMIPVASPQIFFVVFLNILNSFKAFGQIHLLTKGRAGTHTQTLVYSIYTQAIQFNRFETACALSFILILIIFLVTRIQFAFEKKVVHYK
ncbi:sugar ABC transporter permease [Treponema sp. OttesenSCG-928-L16]|nr:sugar ABC transporter permease [Treponema sp. OttesenSCG-928-L16]